MVWLALVIGSAAGWQLHACAVPATPKLLNYDEASYLEVAEQIVGFDEIPRVGIRPPLYPAILALFLVADPDLGLSRIVQFQRIAWVGSAILVGLLTFTLTGRSLAGLFSALLFLSMGEPLSLVRLIYAEMVASTLALLALGLFSVGCRSAADRWWMVTSALAAAAAAYSRPIFQLLFPILVALALIEPTFS